MATTGQSRKIDAKDHVDFAHLVEQWHRHMLLGDGSKATIPRPNWSYFLECVRDCFGAQRSDAETWKAGGWRLRQRGRAINARQGLPDLPGGGIALDELPGGGIAHWQAVSQTTQAGVDLMFGGAEHPRDLGAQVMAFYLRERPDRIRLLNPTWVKANALDSCPEADRPRAIRDIDDAIRRLE